MNRITVLALALAISSTAYAGNNNGPDYGDVTTNNNQTYNQPTANAAQSPAPCPARPRTRRSAT